jgi:hypothetical protein
MWRHVLCKPKALIWTIADLTFVGHAYGFANRDETDLHDLCGFPVGLALIDADGEIDISDLVGDVVGGVELAGGAQIGGTAADLFQRFAVGDFLWRQA